VQVIPVSDLRPFGENIWTADGPLVRDMRIWFTTRMTVVKLASGSMWLESPIPVSDDTLKSITDMGPVRYLVANTARHVWRLDAAHTLFPDAQLWVPRETHMTLKQGDLQFTGTLTDTPPDDWADDFEQLVFKGNSLLAEVLFYHKKSGTVILGDLIQNHRKVKGKLLTNFMARIGGVSYPHGGVARDIRMSFRKRELARESLERLLSWDFDKLIIAHGDCVESDAKSYVEEKFSWLKH
jgi:hypothetical protein